MILIDSCVLLDILTVDSDWYSWSANALSNAGSESELVINPIVYAEVSARFATPDDFDEIFPSDEFRRLALPYSAAFLASKAHLDYRLNGGKRSATLPDFFIGAHAAVAGYDLLTRDPRRFRKYFPSVGLICP
jgi:predicted nucleic acid-binding protein